MVEIHDPVFADELMEQWKMTEEALLKLHADGALTPYICRKVEIDIEKGKKTGFGTQIDLTCERSEQEEFEAWCKCYFFDDEQNPKNIVCYQGSEVLIHELLHSNTLKKPGLKQVGSIAVDYEPFWSKGVLTTDAKIDAAKEVEKKCVADREKCTALQEENERLKQELAQVRPPRNAAANEKVQLNHVKKWKSHAVIMVKVAYELGLSKAKELTHAELTLVCKRHGKLPSTPYDLLRAALPEGVVKKDPGPKVKS